MLADIHGKISESGSNLTDRLEDYLTGTFFGTLRYISFHKGLGALLSRTMKPIEMRATITRLTYDYWARYVEFWPYHQEGEFDVVIDFPELLIGIEVKYLSGLSSNDEEDFVMPEDSKNQLSREARILQSRSNKPKLLLFIAPQGSCQSIYKASLPKMPKDVAFAYITWEDIYESLKFIQSDNIYEQVMVEDLQAFLKKRGFERFKSMEVESETITNEHYQFNSKKIELFSFQTTIEVKEDYYVFRNEYN